MTRERRWWLLGAIGIVVLAVIAGAAMLRGGQPAAEASAPAAPRVPIVRARNGQFVERVDAQGRVGAPGEEAANLAFAQAGVIRSIDVHVGEHVTAGQQLGELDRAVLGAALRGAAADVEATGTRRSPNVVHSANARLAVALEKVAALSGGGVAARNVQIVAQASARQAEIKVAVDRRTLARQQELFRAGVVAGKDVDAAREQVATDTADVRASAAKSAVAATDARTALAQARADVTTARSDLEAARGQTASAQARFEAAQLAFAHGVLVAPMSGFVTSILKRPGESVDPSNPVLVIGAASSGRVTMTVPASTAQRIVVGAAVRFRETTPGIPDAGGVVTAIVPAVDPIAQTATIVANGAPAGAITGEAISATIVVDRINGVIVPTSAVVQDPQTGRNVVFVKNARAKLGDSVFIAREIVVRASDATNAVLASGVRAGEPIAAQGGYMLLAPAGG